MADLSGLFNPSDITSKAAANSDAASNALSQVALASDASSDALSKIAALSDVVSKLAVSIASDITSAASNAMSDAASRVAVVSAAASDAASAASDALSKVAVVSDAASKAMSQANSAAKRTVILKVYNEASAIATGDGKMYFAVPATLNGMNLVSVAGHLYTAATSGVVGVQIANVTSGVDMLSSARILEWDATEKDTTTCAASSVAKINTSNDNVVTGEEIRVDVDAAGSGAKGLEVRLTFQTP